MIFLQKQNTFCSVARLDRVKSWFLKIFQFLSATCASNNLKQLYFRNIVHSQNAAGGPFLESHGNLPGPISIFLNDFSLITQ